MSVTTYPKISTPFKRHFDGPDKGKLIIGDWAVPELEYLQNNEFEFTEKVDGCVSPKTNVRMADGSRKRITAVRVGDYVLGHDETGVVASRVNAVKMQPTAGEWVRVRATREGLGSGNSFGQVVCTHDHKIWTPDRGWVEAHQLKPGDKVLSSRTDLSLSPLQEQVLVGKMLGDGSLAYHDNSLTASVEFGHVSEELVDWTLRGLGELSGNKGSRVSGYGSQIVTGRSKQMAGVYSSFRSWLNDEGVKIVPKSISLSPISMAFWYMDDGSLSHNEGQEDRLRLATNGFDEDSCLNLQKALEAHGVYSSVKDYKGNTICLDSSNAERFFLSVAPYLPKAMQYKLPERYRGHDGWLPISPDNAFHSMSVVQTVTSVERVPAVPRWDIETETSNFFTAGMLVHNTNIRIELSRDPRSVTISHKGRTDNANIPKHLLEHLGNDFPALSIEPGYYTTERRARLRFLHQWMVENDLLRVTLYGEGYGPKIQKGGGNYRKDASFVLFDVRIGDLWLDRENVNDVAEKLGIDSVPVFENGTLHDAIRIVREGRYTDGYQINKDRHFEGLKSQWGDFEAEGLVCRPIVPLFGRNGHRIITKIKGIDFK